MRTRPPEPRSGPVHSTESYIVPCPTIACCSPREARMQSLPLIARWLLPPGTDMSSVPHRSASSCCTHLTARGPLPSGAMYCSYNIVLCSIVRPFYRSPGGSSPPGVACSHAPCTSTCLRGIVSLCPWSNSHWPCVRCIHRTLVLRLRACRRRPSLAAGSSRLVLPDRCTSPAVRCRWLSAVACPAHATSSSCPLAAIS